jgi:hypothetical protein
LANTQSKVGCEMIEEERLKQWEAILALGKDTEIFQAYQVGRERGRREVVEWRIQLKEWLPEEKKNG